MCQEAWSRQRFCQALFVRAFAVTVVVPANSTSGMSVPRVTLPVSGTSQGEADTVAMSESSVPPAAAGRDGRFGAWRALTALPAMVGSLLLLVVLFGGLSRWEALVLLGWLAAGAALFTASGERLAVRVGCGFRRPSTAQAVTLAPLWAAALRQSGIAADGVDLYVKRARQPNAYAVGGRSVAVTTGIVEEHLAHRLAADELVAVLVHDLLTAPTPRSSVAVPVSALSVGT